MRRSSQIKILELQDKSQVILSGILVIKWGVVMLVDSDSMYCNLITAAHPHCSYRSTLATKRYTLLSYTLQPVQPGKRTKQSLVLI